MAVINVSFDTKTKKSTVAIDGKNLKNISSVLLDRYTWEDGDGKVQEESHIEVSTREFSEEDKLAKRTILYASKEVENALSIDKLEGYVDEESDKVSQAVSKWLVNFSRK